MSRLGSLGILSLNRYKVDWHGPGKRISILSCPGTLWASRALAICFRLDRRRIGPSDEWIRVRPGPFWSVPGGGLHRAVDVFGRRFRFPFFSVLSSEKRESLPEISRLSFQVLTMLTSLRVVIIHRLRDERQRLQIQAEFDAVRQGIKCVDTSTEK